MAAKGEFIFVDESGDPGARGNPVYILVASHMSGAVFDRVRLHVATFRYFHEVMRELKDWGGLLADKPTPQWRSFMGFLADLTEAGEITTTAHWLNKATYRKGGGPYLYEGADTQKFRNFQIRLLLERHRGRRPWSDMADIVLDRWSMSQPQRHNLEDYIRGNWRFQPLGHVTTVDSAYVDSVQIVDLYARLIRRSVEEEATEEQEGFLRRLVDLEEVVKGLY